MEETLIERASHAVINELLRQDILITPDSSDVAGEMDIAALARAVISAIREPSDKMLEAAAGIDVGGRVQSGGTEYWQAMIDAALTERAR